MHEFAADVLQRLLQHITTQNYAGARHRFEVSHAWIDGPTIHLVYAAPPSNVTWGLVRDTRESIIDGQPWDDVDEAVRFYYLIDLEENWPGNFSRQPGEPDAIRWSGHRHDGLPTRSADLPASSRQPEPIDPAPPNGTDTAITRTEPRRYRNPL